MSLERPFFRDSDTSFGIFYPVNHLIAVFKSPAVAEAAATQLRASGIAAADVLVIDAAYVIEDVRTRLTEAGWLDRLLQAMSIGKEARFWNDDLAWAEQGAGFVAAYCPTDEIAQVQADLLRPHAPLSMRRYRALAIETLT